MSYDLVIGGERQVDLATITGWKRFRTWAEKFDASKYPQLAHFIAENWSQELDDLATELSKSIKAKKPTADVLDIVNTIITECNSAGEDVASIFVTDGMTDKDVEDDWEISEDEPETKSFEPSGTDTITAIAKQIANSVNPYTLLPWGDNG